MKVAVILASLCLVAFVSAAPSTTKPEPEDVPDSSTTPAPVPVSSEKTATVSDVATTTSTKSPETKDEDDEKVVVTKDFFPDDYLFYTSEHDIVSIVIPINGLNFDEAEEDDGSDDDSATIFFVEADIKDGKKQYKGLYVHDRNSSKLLLANGRDAASSINDKSKDAFFAADDGIYSYDVKTNSAKKYGTFDKSSFAIAKPNGTDEIYVLTDEKDLYKISNEGKDAVKIDAIEKAETIVIDSENNLYFYTAGKAPRVFDGTNIKEFSDLPSNPSYVALIRPSFMADDGSIIAVIDEKAYILYSNGTSDATSFELQVHPTAYGMEAGLIHYYAYEKKIYEYNFLAMIFGGFMEGLKDYVENKAEDIQRYAAKPRSAFNRR